MFPIFVMIAFSFNNVPGRINAKWYGFTLLYWRHPFLLPDLTASLGLSLKIAILATVVTAPMGALLGLALGRYRFRGEGAVNFLLFLNIAAPEIVLGTGLLTMLASMKFPLGFWSILLAHVMFCIAFVAVTVRARVVGLNTSLEEAASDLGADALTTFRLVTLPLIMPAVVAGALLSFALSVDDFIITAFVRGPSITFPLYVYGATKTGIPPQVNVIGSILFLVGVFFAIVSAILPTLKGRREAKAIRKDLELIPDAIGIPMR